MQKNFSVCDNKIRDYKVIKSIVKMSDQDSAETEKLKLEIIFLIDYTIQVKSTSN